MVGATLALNTLIAVSIGVKQSQETLRTALAMGADRAILVVATDDERISDAARAFGAEVIITPTAVPPGHPEHYLEKAKVLYAEASSAQGLNADQQETLAAAGEAIRNAEGRKAYDLLTPLVAEIRASSLQYQVVRGDSLWSISGQQQVYNNPYQWPLIYKANRDKIKDADLIYPGQTFSVDRNPSAGEAAAAIDHAKNRGAWSIGVVEQTDRRYLGGSLELQ